MSTAIKVIGYCRCSTEEQAREGVTLAAQEAKIRTYCDLHDLELVDVLRDEGFTGKSLDRPALQQALSLLRTGQAQGMIVLKLDRLTRKVAGLAWLLDEYFCNSRLVPSPQLHSVQDRIDTETPAGRLILNILASVAQWEVEEIGRRTKDALAYKVSQGAKLGTPGLRAMPQYNQTIERITAMRGLGRSFREIAEALNQDAFCRPVRGASWKKGTIHALCQQHGIA